MCRQGSEEENAQELHRPMYAAPASNLPRHPSACHSCWAEKSGERNKAIPQQQPGHLEKAPASVLRTCAPRLLSRIMWSTLIALEIVLRSPVP